MTGLHSSFIRAMQPSFRIPARGMIASWFGIAAFSLGGCLTPLEAPSRYDQVEPLCGDPVAWAAAVEDCRRAWEDDASCGGLLHFEGRIDGIDVSVASEVVESEFENLRYVGGEEVRLGISVLGQTDYNELNLSFNGMGGEIGPDVDLPPLLLAPVDHELGDYLVDANLRMSNGFQSQDLRVVEGSMQRLIQDDVEQAGSFSAAFAKKEDRVDGCFHLFVTRLTTASSDETKPDVAPRPDPEDRNGAG